MKTACWIGNDIVDLAEAGVAGKERDRRFLERVFTAAERAQILDAMAPTLALWKTWAAKEAAYKVACKIREKVIFAHHAFEVVMERHEGLVRFEDLVVRVRWELQREYVHCVGQLVPDHADASRPRGLPPENGSRHHFLSAVAHALQPLDGSLTTAERASVHSLASERARLLARKITEQWGLGSAEIIRRWRTWGWSAPVLAREGRRVEGFDVSLSHDGRYVAAAVAGPRWPV
ncbi:MAG: 4'-phosphopantetheinyl transferase superfamily protein [Bacteroidales bacterium]